MATSEPFLGASCSEEDPNLNLSATGAFSSVGNYLDASVAMLVAWADCSSPHTLVGFSSAIVSFCVSVAAASVPAGLTLPAMVV